jgi:FixJ family two-component response regulator
MSRCPALTRTPTVSVVDDDESVRVAIGALVRSLGRVACTFASAEDFLNSPEAEDTDCLIADIQMPGMTGIELQQTLATRGNRVPIVFITAFPEARIREHVLAAGAVCLLSKPCDSDALVTFIESALSLRPEGTV